MASILVGETCNAVPSCFIVKMVGRDAAASTFSGALRAINWCFGPRTYNLAEELSTVPTNEVPAQWWQTACEQTHMPLACVDSDNKFVWVNTAFEHLVGYSPAELKSRTWMSITEQSDVGGDLASAEQIRSGSITNYSMSKRYIHKRGYPVPIELCVWRFPVNGLDDLRCFISEAAPAVTSQGQLQAIEEQMRQEVRDLEARLKSGTEVRVNVGDHWRDGDNVRGDKNSDKTIRWLIVGLCSVAAMAAWSMYYIATMPKPVPPQAPTEFKTEAPVK